MSNPSNKKALRMLFERPLEPVFTIRDGGKAVFDLPDCFYEEGYQNSNNITSRSGGNVETRIPLRELPHKPDLRFTEPIKKRQQFSIFNSEHREIAGRLVKIFMDAPDEDLFISTCAYCKDRVNPFLFQYCYAVAVQHRTDTQDFSITPICEIFPHDFVKPDVFQEARKQSEIFEKENRLIEIEHIFTASDREDEQRLAYFREDIGVNSHHWHWHLVYPSFGGEIIKKDRRGELFYYMHHQILARYNVERFCNNLNKVKPLNDIDEPIPEGYFPKILDSSKNRTYPPRIPDQRLRDLNRHDHKLEIEDLKRWADRIVQAIDQGYITNSEGENIELDSVEGIDKLGDLVEATDFSINLDNYGDLHNQGHNAIAYSHDPDSHFLEDGGVMAQPTTAMRDPIFYRWHDYIDNIFNRHKRRLDPYNNAQLNYSGITIMDSEVRMTNVDENKPNILKTFWVKSELDLNAGLDFGTHEPVHASFIHLQHSPYDYIINVLNDTGDEKRGTCRIFLCPKTDERNEPLSLEEQRLLAIEMDKFSVELNPGENLIFRSSTDSSVTIPYERSFRSLANQSEEERARTKFEFCGCGWPNHMLLPRGKPEGMEFELFVMISNFEDDYVQQLSCEFTSSCKDAYSFCGLRDQLYPDKRSMGFPFDRRLPETTLDNLIDQYPNMKKTDIKIQFQDKLQDNPLTRE